MASKRRTKDERERAAEIENSVTTLMYEGIENNADDWRRDHLGASQLGHKCDRYLWLSFRWALDPKHDGKQLRLFSRGDREEPAIVDDLRNAGMTVSAPCLIPSDQHTSEMLDEFRVRWGHVGGSSDAKIVGVPGLDQHEWVLGEFKTSNAKSFEYLKQKKVRSAKREHWVQMQIYMHGLGLKHALYIVVRKDTDDIYVELVDFDESAAEEYLARGQLIVNAEEPPLRMDSEEIPCVYVSKDGTRWPCDYFELCHGAKMPERNCRTCVDSTAKLDADGEPIWTCENSTLLAAENEGCELKAVDFLLFPEGQRGGCSLQQSIPPIVNGDVVSIDKTQAVYQFADGGQAVESVYGMSKAAAEAFEGYDEGPWDPNDRDGVDD